MNQLRNTVAETLEQLLERLADNKQVSDSDLDALSDDLRIARQDDGDRETLEAARELLSDIPSTNYAHGRLIEMRSEVLLKLQGLDRMQLLKKRFRGKHLSSLPPATRNHPGGLRPRSKRGANIGGNPEGLWICSQYDFPMFGAPGGC